MKFKIVGLLAAFLIFGCTDELVVIKEIEVEKSWKQQNKFENLSKIKINSYSTADQLYLYGPEYFSRIDKDNNVKHAISLFNYPLFYRLPISETYFIEAEGKWIRFVKSKMPVHDEGAALIDLEALAPDYVSTYYGYFYQSSAIDINTNGQCIVPINSNNPNHDLVAYLFSTSLENNNEKIKITDTTRINLPNPDYFLSGAFYCVKAFEDYFILSIHNNTFKVYSDGHFRKVLDEHVINIFQQGNRLFAVKQFNQIFISEDDGETWQAFENYPDTLVLARYFTLGDSLIATRYSDIFSVKFVGNNYTARPLRNDGLETNEITSISQFLDSIYVSTYSGVFYKAKNKFFESKGVE